MPLVELLYFDSCPNYADYMPRLRALLAAAGIPGDVTLCSVDSEDAAVAQRFLGSPTVRVNGHDVEPNADARHEYGLQCRLYRTAAGWSGYPADEWVSDALARPAAEVG